MTTTKITHRTYAGWTIEALLAEMDRLGIDRRGDGSYLRVLLDNPTKTGRWCAVQTLVDHHAAGVTA